MTPQSLREKLKSGEEILLIDVRTEKEFQNGPTVPGAENIPMEFTADEIMKRNTPKDRKIILICRSGNRSGLVAGQLKGLGYDAENLDGGVIEWMNSFGTQ